MLRKAVLFLASILVSTGALAIGLGEMDLTSGLNEPLKAEIELLSVNADEIDGLKVALASASDFKRLGVERLFLLTKLKFKVIINKNGKPVIRVRSKDAYKEPFLDMVIEVTWSKGRLLREYTALIDPPVLMKQQSAPVVTAAVATPRPIAKTQAAAPTPITSTESAADSSDDELFPRIPIDGEASAPTFSGDSYGPTKRTDTLWSVTKKVKDEDVSMEQMMLAITRKNPQAFTDGNVNTIKDGYVLRIPDRSEATSISRREAYRVVKEHHRQWEEIRAGQTYRATKVRGDVRGEEKPAAKAAMAEDAKLKVIAGKSDEKIAIETGGKGKDSGELKKQIEQTAKAAEKVRGENESLQGKVQELEQKLAEMERSISIKDKELATLQQSLERTGSVTDKAVRSNKDMNPYAIKETPEDKAAATPAPAKEQPEPVTQAPKAAAKPQPKPQPKQQPQASSFVDELLGNPLMLAAAVALLLLIGALGWMIVGKRRVSRMKMDFQESILTGKPVSGAPAEAGPVSTTVEEDSSFLSDFSVSGIEGIQTEVNDVDPVAEADVYVAYGRHKQAEELINDAIAKEPERHELKVKLLEIYYSGKNKDAFEAQAEELYAMLGGQAGPMWDKVVVMGKDLCPDNPLFGAAAVVESAPDQASQEVPDDVQEQPVTEDTIPEIPEIGEDMAAEDTLAGMGMDSAETPFSDSALGESVVEESTEAKEEPEISFDSDTVETESDDLDFNLDLDETTDTGLGESAETTGSDITEASDLDFTLDEEETADLGEEAESSELDGGFFAEDDEVSTKLDLAKAYIDMGDPDGARSILTEVLEEGNDDQKQEANDLMKQIS